MPHAVRTNPLALVLEDLGLRPERVRSPGDPPAPLQADGGHALLAVAPDEDPTVARRALLQFAESALSEEGLLLLVCEGGSDERALASWRDALWPLLHVGARYRLRHDGLVRFALGGRERLRGTTGLTADVLVARRRAHVLSPRATQAKFDQNAGGWNASPQAPGYAHYRWMRRYVGTFADARGARRILDFGSGAGWVGIEAARVAGEAELCLFDPSPELARHAEENARAAGLARVEARVGFGEEPPFPAPGEAAFDLVLCSGVISFSPDPQRFLDGLVRAVAPGGRLVIGDLQRESRGMRRRRERRVLLPIRELNAFTHQELRPELERRGLVFEAARGYQLSWPMPQFMHWNETRLGGALDRPCVALNRLAGALLGGIAPRSFDSWVMRFAKPR